MEGTCNTLHCTSLPAEKPWARRPRDEDGQPRDLGAGQPRDPGAGQPRDLGAGQPRDLRTGQPRDLEAGKYSLMIDLIDGHWARPG